MAPFLTTHRTCCGRGHFALLPEMRWRRCARELRDALEAVRSTDGHDRDRIYLFPPDESDLSRWTALLAGPEATPYDAFFFQFDITVPDAYPVLPPSFKVSAKTPIFHPNIHWKTGEICLDVLKSEWSPAWSLISTCRAILTLLTNPQADSPLNCDAGNLLRHGDVTGFNSLARMYAVDHGISKAALVLPDMFKAAAAEL